MSEKTDPVVNDALQKIDASPQQDIDMLELAEYIVKLMLKELELERMRSGNY